MIKQMLIVLALSGITNIGFSQEPPQREITPGNQVTGTVTENQKNPWKNTVIPLFMLTMGIGMAGIWTLDIASGKFRQQGNFFQWRNDGGDYMWTHILAEYLTGIALVTGGISRFADAQWAFPVALIALGALAYTSLNNLGWTFVEKSRTAYAVPMALGFAGSIISIFILL